MRWLWKGLQSQSKDQANTATIWKEVDGFLLKVKCYAMQRFIPLASLIGLKVEDAGHVQDACMLGDEFVSNVNHER